MIVLELLHLKMEVTVSEPCDVIRVMIRVINCISCLSTIQQTNLCKYLQIIMNAVKLFT